eukprot:1192477-Prorocentrum_minimum.AAC.3
MYRKYRYVAGNKCRFLTERMAIRDDGTRENSPRWEEVDTHVSPNKSPNRRPLTYQRLTRVYLDSILNLKFKLVAAASLSGDPPVPEYPVSLSGGEGAAATPKTVEP